MSKRRVLHAVAALWFSIGSIIFPVREAHAVIPLVAVAVTAIGSGGGSGSSLALVGTIASALVGGSIIALAITPAAISDGDTSVRVPTTASNSSAAMPAPAAPTNQSPYTQYYATAGGDYASSPGEACQSYLTASTNACYSFAITSSPSGTGTCFYDATYHFGGSCTGASEGTVFHMTVGIASQVSCPTGYSASGSTCILIASPRAVTADKNYDLSRSGTSYSAPTATGEADAKPGYVNVSSSGSGQIWGKDSDGNPFLTTITPTAAGGSNIQTQKQVGGVVQTTAIAIDAYGGVTSVSNTAAPGTVSAASTAGVAPAVATGTEAASIQFPDDYARQATTQAIRTGIDQLHRDLTDQSNVSDPALPLTSQFDDSFFKTTFTALKSWQLPSHTSQCPAGTFNLFNKAFVMDSHCTLINNYWGALQGAMAVVWTLLALFIVLGA